ncbi:MAG TPA: glycoside hydrolase family 38 C-terminal domain-containing protein, partial [Deinococcales bacterium]|nr:glycoside hydrolase family 38 C-terminal domain-containing protein [Deinococcales bacterium]
TVQHLTNAQRLDILTRKLDMVNAWRDALTRPLEGWRCSAPGREARPIAVGEAWPYLDPAVRDGPVSFECEFVVPAAFAGRPLELELDVGGEALAVVTGGSLPAPVSGGLNPYHRSLPLLARAAGGEAMRVMVEAVPKGPGGEPASGRLALARLVAPQPEVREFHADFAPVLEAAYHLGVLEPVQDVAAPLIAAAEEGLAGLPWPTSSTAQLSRLGSGVIGDAGRLWSLPQGLPQPEPLDEESLAALAAARERLDRALARVRRLHPPLGRLALSGHAHLDLAWLWPVAEARRKARRTAHTVLGLMDRYPDFTFNQSSAQQYAWLEEDDPALFERLRQRVAEGRYEPVGGMWVEPDANLTGGESLARQLLYGQRYFLSRFGRACTVAWLPDTFGFTPALPQLLASAGMSGFLTTKLSWNESTRFPHDLFLWEGLDGSRVLAHTFFNPTMRAYNGILKANDVLGTYRQFRGRHLPVWGEEGPEGLFTFGYGDGGGGPTGEMIEQYRRLRDLPGMPGLRMARVEDYYASLPREGLPVWSGELYLEFHRGTYTSQARVKRLNRAAEHRLLEAEALAAVAALDGAAYPAAPLRAAWETLLLTQFHDILPGSSIREAYEEALPALEGVVRQASRLRDEALSQLAAAGETGDGWWAVANPSLDARPLLVELPGAAGAAWDGEGCPLAAQEVEGGLLVKAAPLAPFALAAMRVGPGTSTSPVEEEAVHAWQEGGAFHLENRELSVTVGPDGSLHRVRDRASEREVLLGRGNRLLAHADLPRYYEAWDVNPNAQYPEPGPDGEEVLGVEDLSLLEVGPLRVAVRVRRRWRSSRIEQTYRLAAASRRLEVVTRIDWRERRVLLKAFFDLRVRSHEAWFETAFGAVPRPTHRNTPHDAARFEVPAHRWADLSEHAYGVSLLNDGRYGHSALGSSLGLSLLRGPMRPDPEADLGEHQFTYALYPHRGGWADGGTRREAQDLNSPLVAVPVAGQPRPGAGGPQASGLEVALASLKAAEDGPEGTLVMRLYEPNGGRGTCRLRWPGLQAAERTDLLENPGAPLAVTDGTLDLPLGPFEIATLRLAFRRPG